jgi:hypothetical protein
MGEWPLRVIHRIIKQDEGWEEVMEKKIKVYVLEKLVGDWQRTTTIGSQKADGPVPDGSYAMIYIKEQHAWLQQINYTAEGVEAHTKVYDKPLSLRNRKQKKILATGIEEARIVWKRFVDDGFKRLSLTDGPCHLNTLIDEDIEIIA